MKYKKMLFIQIIILIIIMSIFIIAQTSFIQKIPSCWIYEKFGILCPSCGGTRCIVNLVKGNFLEAFFYHSIFFISIIYLIILDIVYIRNTIKKDKKYTWIYPKPYYAIIWAIVLILFTFQRNLYKFDLLYKIEIGAQILEIEKQNESP